MCQLLREFTQRLQQQPLVVQQRPRLPGGHGQLRRLTIIRQIHLITEVAVIMATVMAMTRHLEALRSHVRQLGLPQSVHHRLQAALVDFYPVCQMFSVVMLGNLLGRL